MIPKGAASADCRATRRWRLSESRERQEPQRPGPVDQRARRVVDLASGRPSALATAAASRLPIGKGRWPLGGHAAYMLSVSCVAEETHARAEHDYPETECGVCAVAFNRNYL